MSVKIVEQDGITRELYKKLSPLGYSTESCQHYAAVISKVLYQKEKRNGVILAHNYQRPEIFEVADFIGDSLVLSQEAAKTDADVIVFCGVHFMAETAKILNPDKTVLLPSMDAGCSLADTADAASVAEKKAELLKQYPDLGVVGYINTTADVKALCDVICTSSNAPKIVNALPNQHILFVPDEHLARYVQSQTAKTIIPWDGNCYVHHEITPEHILEIKHQKPHVKVLVHPECREDVIALADAALSTEGMVRYAKQSDAKEFLVVTECGLSDRLLIEAPDKTFYRTCRICRFMKAITLEDTLASLQNMQFEITLDETTRQKAEKALRRMLELS